MVETPSAALVVDRVWSPREGISAIGANLCGRDAGMPIQCVATTRKAGGGEGSGCRTHRGTPGRATRRARLTSTVRRDPHLGRPVGGDTIPRRAGGPSASTRCGEYAVGRRDSALSCRTWTTGELDQVQRPMCPWIRSVDSTTSQNRDRRRLDSRDESMIRRGSNLALERVGAAWTRPPARKPWLGEHHAASRES